MNYRDLKVGDRVTRRIGMGGPAMEMEVTEVKDDVIVCAACKDGKVVFHGGWQFHRDHGCEEDEELGWGAKFRVTGSYLERK